MAEEPSFCQSPQPNHLRIDRQMLLERNEVFDSCSAQSMRRSSVPRQFWKNPMACRTAAKTSLVDKFMRVMPTASKVQSDREREKERDIESGSHYTASWKGKPTSLRLHRSILEQDVMRLEERLQEELDLHSALESAIAHAAVAFPEFPSHLPLHAQELLADVAMLEMTVKSLEEQLICLDLQLRYERKERQNSKGNLQHKTASPDHAVEPGKARTLHKERIWSPNTVPAENHAVSVQGAAPRIACDVGFLESPASQKGLRVASRMFRRSSQPSPSGSFSSIEDCGIRPTALPSRSRQDAGTIREQFWPATPSKDSRCESEVSSRMVEKGGLETIDGSLSRTASGETFDREIELKKQSRTLRSYLRLKPPGILRSLEESTLWRHPNRLSQEMVSCMIGIYCRLADPLERHLVSERVPSPNSPLGLLTSSSVSSLSESSLSLMSFSRSQSVDITSKEMGAESSFDPYTSGEKLPWAHIGKYNSAVEVSWMSVGKEQLEYAAEALRMFRSLVEQLARVDAASMIHEKKLAFWINVYNALMLHAYLAYGVPRSDSKYFALMQKAAYTVGGHSFNAVTIEHILLKDKAPVYRPPIALLLALHKIKIPEEANKFAIDRPEPLITFALSCGACSSPAVRIYTAENVHAELQAALQDYVRASVGITSKGKLLVPKLLHSFARSLVDEGAILEWICQWLPCSQAFFVQDCFQQRRHRFLNSRHFSVVPFDFRFRYLFLLDECNATSGDNDDT